MKKRAPAPPPGLPPEEVLVSRLAAAFRSRRRDVVVGIGDDAAVISVAGPVALSTDVLVEGEDFSPDADPRRLGRKALSVNLSDLAAVGATPLHALLTLGLPRATDPAWFDAFVEGFRSCAEEYGVAVVGGDLSAAPVRFASVTVTGRIGEGGALTRDGGKPGDLLFVSGTLGPAAAGLALLAAGYRLGAGKSAVSPTGRKVPAPRGEEKGRLIRHHLDPRPMVELGRRLADQGLASAAVDLSDGLARDLHRLCRASGCGAVLEAEALPVDSALADLPAGIVEDPLRTALFGGEDFGLLFSVPLAKGPAVDRLASRFALRRIGRLVENEGVTLLRAGRRERVPDAGFDHFPVSAAGT